MQIDPLLQGRLFLLAFLCGIGLGALWDAVLLLRVLTGAAPRGVRLASLYERPLPLLGRSVGFSPHLARRAWQTFSLSFWQLLFPALGALAVLCLSFGYHRGVIRLPVPLLLLLGFFLWRRLISRCLAPLFDLLAFLLSALALYLRALLLLPLRVFCRLLSLLVLRPVRVLLGRWRTGRLCRRSQSICRAQLRAATDGTLLRQDLNKRKRNVKLCQIIKKEGAPPHH